MSKPPFPAAIGKRFRAARPLADLLAPCIAPALARQGFGEADILMHWPEIVGPGLAERCQPVKLQWRARPAKADPDARVEPATLIVRVEGAFALTLQHMAPTVVEKVNVHLGWRCVGRLALRQGPMLAAAPKRAGPAKVDPVATARATEMAGGFEADGLRAALVRLGSRVLAGPSPRGPRREN